MAKDKINVSSKEITTSETHLNEIERFVREAGSDHLPTFGGEFEGGIQCQQVPDEIAPCILAILESGETIKSYLEIGSAAGGSAFIINHFFNPSKIVLVDNNQHPKAHIRQYILRDVVYEEIIGNSHDEGTAAKVEALDTLFDMVMIDGDHMYEGAKADVETYIKFLRPGGLLVFHDSQIGYPYGCAKVFEDIKADQSLEFIKEFVSEKYNKCGIGLFRKAAINENK